jgi:hypothetical protein
VYNCAATLCQESERVTLSPCNDWSEWQDLNLRPPRPERQAPAQKSRKMGTNAVVQSANGTGTLRRRRANLCHRTIGEP